MFLFFGGWFFGQTNVMFCFVMVSYYDFFVLIRYIYVCFWLCVCVCMCMCVCVHLLQLE
jgi:hypothetical protein